MQTLSFNKQKFKKFNFKKIIVSPIATWLLKNIVCIILTEIFTDFWLTVSIFLFWKVQIHQATRSFVLLTINVPSN